MIVLWVWDAVEEHATCCEVGVLRGARSGGALVYEWVACARPHKRPRFLSLSVSWPRGQPACLEPHP